jgi:hypothetical protein
MQLAMRATVARPILHGPSAPYVHVDLTASGGAEAISESEREARRGIPNDVNVQP